MVIFGGFVVTLGGDFSVVLGGCFSVVDGTIGLLDDVKISVSSPSPVSPNDF